MNTMRVIELVKSRETLKDELLKARLLFGKLRTKESLEAYRAVSLRVYNLYDETYTMGVFIELFNVCLVPNEEVFIDMDHEGNYLIGYMNHDGVPTLTLKNRPPKQKEILPEPKVDTRPDYEIVYEFIQHNELSGIECSKKFIESMLSGKISRAKITDSLTRLTMIGLNGKKIVLVDSIDITMTDKVYKIV